VIEWGSTGHLPASYARCWFYGPPGTGKTVLAACFPEPCLINVANEDSIATLRGMPQDRPYAIIGVAPQNLRQDQPVPIRADLEQLLNALLAANAEGVLHQRFGRTIVFDGFSYYNDMCIAEIAHGKMTRGDTPGKMTDQKWGVLRAHYLNIRDVLWRLPMHVVITSFAQTRSRGNEILYAGPYLAGSAAELLPGSVGALGYLETEPSGRRVCWFQQRGQYPARCRYPGVSTGPIPNHEVWSHLAASLGHPNS